MKPPALKKHDRANFATLLKAVEHDRVCLLSVIRKADKKPVAMVCAVNTEDGKNFSFVPLAVMMDVNPYEAYEPPTVVGTARRNDMSEQTSEPVTSASAWADAKVAVAIQVDNDGNAKVALSLCNPLDQFDKSKGRHIARCRLLGNSPRCLIWRGKVRKNETEPFRPLQQFIIPVTKIVHAVVYHEHVLDGLKQAQVVQEIQDRIYDDCDVEADEEFNAEVVSLLSRKEK